jgi:hypothetical protein
MLFKRISIQDNFPSWILNDTILTQRISLDLTDTQFFEIQEFSEVLSRTSQLLTLYETVLSPNHKNSTSILQRLYYDLSHLALMKKISSDNYPIQYMLSVGIGEWHEQLAMRLSFPNLKESVGVEVDPRIIIKARDSLAVYRHAFGQNVLGDPFKIKEVNILNRFRPELAHAFPEYNAPPLDQTFDLVTWFHPHPHEWFRRNWGQSGALDLLIPFISKMEQRLSDDGYFVATFDEQYWGRNADEQTGQYRGFQNFINYAENAGLHVEMVPGTLYANKGGYSIPENLFQQKIRVTHFTPLPEDGFFSENYGGKDLDYLIIGTREQLTKWVLQLKQNY